MSNLFSLVNNLTGPIVRTLSTQVVGNHTAVVAGNGANVVAGDYDTISGGANDWISLGSNGFVTAGDNATVSAGNNDIIGFSGDGSLSAGNNDVITLAVGAVLTVTGLGSGDDVNAGGLTSRGIAGAGNASLTFGAKETVTVNGTGDTIVAGKGSTITFGGQAGALGGATPTKVSDTIGANTTGATIDSGLGCDTIAAGVGYEGGDTYIGSYHDDADGRAGIGSCINYSDLGLAMTDGDTAANPQAGLRTTIDLDTGAAYGYAANGKLLWTDTLVDMQQAKAANGNGDILIASNSYYSELKGAGGTTSYYCGDHGTTVFWGWNTNVGQDIAYGDANAADDYVWRTTAADPNGNDPTRLASVLGQLVQNFDVDNTGSLNLAKGDTLDFSQVNSLWSGLSDLANWSAQSDGHGGTDLVVQGIGTAVDLGNENLDASQLSQLVAGGHLLV